MLKKIFIGLGILFGLPLVAAIIMVATGYEAAEANPEETAAMRTQVIDRLSVLDAIIEDDEASWEAENECPLDALAGVEKVEVLSYHQIHDYLDKSSDEPSGSAELTYDLVSLKLDSLDRRVTDETLASDLNDIVAGSSMNFDEAATIYGAKVLAVIRSEQFQEPKTGVKFTGQFFGGSYEGKVRLVDVPSKKTICQVSMTVRSSNEIDKMPLGRSDNAISKDFEEQFEAAKVEVQRKLNQAPLAW